MSDAIIATIVSGVLTLAGTMLTVFTTNRRTTATYEKTTAVIEERVRTLSDEVHKHNNFAERIPVLSENNRCRQSPNFRSGSRCA